jgi:choline dehydrogenase-like flavoprotein
VVFHELGFAAPRVRFASQSGPLAVERLDDKGGELLYLARADKLQISGGKVTGIECLGLDERCVAPNGRKILVKAKHYVLAAGGINSPALLMRSGAPDPHSRLGKRTFLHLVNFSAALFDEEYDQLLRSAVAAPTAEERRLEAVPTIAETAKAP